MSFLTAVTRKLEGAGWNFFYQMNQFLTVIIVFIQESPFIPKSNVKSKQNFEVILNGIQVIKATFTLQRLAVCAKAPLIFFFAALFASQRGTFNPKERVKSESYIQQLVLLVIFTYQLLHFCMVLYRKLTILEVYMFWRDI